MKKAPVTSQPPTGSGRSTDGGGRDGAQWPCRRTADGARSRQRRWARAAAARSSRGGRRGTAEAPHLKRPRRAVAGGVAVAAWSKRPRRAAGGASGVRVRGSAAGGAASGRREQAAAAGGLGEPKQQRQAAEGTRAGVAGAKPQVQALAPYTRNSKGSVDDFEGNTSPNRASGRTRIEGRECAINSFGIGGQARA
ncbi:hypothetical protein SEVIR_4G074301v4 [Setaria viridis]|uniref:Uncharacterized protein n=1 Tax=Setaria viridis TaxID=4556 RepID=A0A4U6V8L2_SETVI|nr:hypothetical protein SEVIR_4G074301v2 [Setaria viridis]